MHDVHAARVSVVMPAYNEGAHIYSNIALTIGVMEDAGFNCEIVAVDDGSSDGTFAEIERAAANHPNVVAARNPYNMGKGMALRTGFDYSSGDIIVFLDADLDLHPDQIQRLISYLESTPCDIVVSSKHHPESRLEYPAFRRIASWGYYAVIKVLFGLPIRDTQTGLKVFRREVLERLFHRILVKKFAYDVELLAAAVRFGCRIREVPVVLTFRRALNWGRIRFGDILHIIVDTLAVFYRLRILRYYDVDRPVPPRTGKPTLVVVPGTPPPPELVERLSVNETITLASVGGKHGENAGAAIHFDSFRELAEWLRMREHVYAFVGFMGAGCIPVGSWLKNAIRNFEDDSVGAVCGPVIPTPGGSVTHRAAGIIASSWLSAGPETFRHSIKRVRTVRSCALDNLVIRPDTLFRRDVCDLGLLERSGILRLPPDKQVIRYDPDVAVSKSYPPVFVPHLRSRGVMAFRKGRDPDRRLGRREYLWQWVPVMVTVFLALGWLFLPRPVYCALAGVYLAVICATALTAFDLRALPFVLVGTAAEHVVRGVMFTAGFLRGMGGAPSPGEGECSSG